MIVADQMQQTVNQQIAGAPRGRNAHRVRLS